MWVSTVTSNGCSGWLRLLLKLRILGALNTSSGFSPRSERTAFSALLPRNGYWPEWGVMARISWALRFGCAASAPTIARAASRLGRRGELGRFQAVSGLVAATASVKLW